jgi:hypothetical protein
MYKILQKRRAVRDIDNYLDMARSMDAQDLADTLIIALQIRNNVVRLGKGDPMFPWRAVAGNPDLLAEIDQAIRHWHAQGDLFSMTRASGALLWSHSLRAVTHAEVRVRARALWAEFARAFPHLGGRARFPEGLDPSIVEERRSHWQSVRELLLIDARFGTQRPQPSLDKALEPVPVAP